MSKTFGDRGCQILNTRPEQSGQVKSCPGGRGGKLARGLSLKRCPECAVCGGVVLGINHGSTRREFSHGVS